eukprot:382990-Rhodomonas_salina.1
MLKLRESKLSGTDIAFTSPPPSASAQPSPISTQVRPNQILFPALAVLCVRKRQLIRADSAIKCISLRARYSLWGEGS